MKITTQQIKKIINEDSAFTIKDISPSRTEIKTIASTTTGTSTGSTTTY